MPRTRQHILGERPRRRYRPAEGVAVTQDEIQAFLAAYEGLDRAEGTVPACLQKELLSYAQKNGVWSGPIFQTRDGRPMHRTYVSAAIRNLCEEAKISGAKGNPTCLRKLYLTTRAEVENNIALLVEQAMERMLEQEQFSVGWEDM